MTRQKIGKLIQLNREKRGFSHRKVEKLIGLSRDVLIDIEKGGDSILYYRELITDSEYQELLEKYNLEE